MKTGSVEDNSVPLLMEPDHKFTNTVALKPFDGKSRNSNITNPTEDKFGVKDWPIG